MQENPFTSQFNPNPTTPRNQIPLLKNCYFCKTNISSYESHVAIPYVIGDDISTLQSSVTSTIYNSLGQISSSSTQNPKNALEVQPSSMPLPQSQNERVVFSHIDHFKCHDCGCSLVESNYTTLTDFQIIQEGDLRQASSQSSELIQLSPYNRSLKNQAKMADPSTENEEFVYKDNNAFHERCFNQANPFCQKCKIPCQDECVQFQSKQYHPHCFVCTQCGAVLDPSKFLLIDGKKCCPSHAQFECCFCHDPILGGFVHIGQRKWHVEHFRCDRCHKSLKLGQEHVLPHLERVLCKECIHGGEGCVDPILEQESLIQGDSFSVDTLPLQIPGEKVVKMSLNESSLLEESLLDSAKASFLIDKNVNNSKQSFIGQGEESGSGGGMDVTNKTSQNQSSINKQESKQESKQENKQEEDEEKEEEVIASKDNIKSNDSEENIKVDENKEESGQKASEQDEESKHGSQNGYQGNISQEEAKIISKVMTQEIDPLAQLKKIKESPISSSSKKGVDQGFESQKKLITQMPSQNVINRDVVRENSKGTRPRKIGKLMKQPTPRTFQIKTPRSFQLKMQNTEKNEKKKKKNSAKQQNLKKAINASKSTPRISRKSYQSAQPQDKKNNLRLESVEQNNNNTQNINNNACNNNNNNNNTCNNNNNNTCDNNNNNNNNYYACNNKWTSRLYKNKSSQNLSKRKGPSARNTPKNIEQNNNNNNNNQRKKVQYNFTLNHKKSRSINQKHSSSASLSKSVDTKLKKLSETKQQQSINNNQFSNSVVQKKRAASLSKRFPKPLKRQGTPAVNSQEFLQAMNKSTKLSSKAKSGTKDYIINEKLKKMEELKEESYEDEKKVQNNELNSTFFKYQDLANKEGRNSTLSLIVSNSINLSKKEEYLRANDFTRVFGMGREEFIKLPAWKRLKLKQDTGLF